MQKELKYLGFIVGQNGIKVDPAKTAAVQEWPRPGNVHEVRKLLGFGNYMRRFIAGYANLVRPMNELLRKEAPFIWSDECEQALIGLKRALVEAPVLTLPDFAENAPPFEMVTDASGYGLGAVLKQGGKIVAYESRSMTPADRNYGVGEQELLAVIHALTVWRCYLEGFPAGVDVITDHAPQHLHAHEGSPLKASGTLV